MNYQFDASKVEVEHALNLYCGLESIASQINAGQRVVPATPQEHYALSVLDTNGINIKNIEGTEGFIQSAIRSTVGVFDWIGKRYWQYGYIIERWVESKISGAVMRAIYKERDVVGLAKKSIFSPEDIVKVIKQPDAEETRIHKLEAATNKGVENGRGFDIPASALLPVISLAKQNKGNGELVTKAISSAGSVDKLIKKHNNSYSDIEIDTKAYVKAYDALITKKEETVKSIIAKLDNAEHTISQADSAIKGDIWLQTFPKDLKKNFHLATDFSNGASIINRAMLKGILRALQDDASKLERIGEKLSASDKGAEIKMAHATKLLKIYTAIIDELMEYERAVNKAQIYASSVSAMALYKIIVKAAKAEVAAN